ncbi:hypothetical protein [Bradymonas sediminis]|uniref:Uncharacterized protein n=1 Tax=Bradymonas sediminis TaxID=1548548 RepID=A0A2Z4FMK3_9DELT|nr:hypothetical protein [Bradymonas sediminis]AWV90199.1 hypothetical protein DN745_12990 [Bradymonas sediminis]TDP75833.1 hypothetical protein DFR33_103180 [Bradymonas sediminis]
MITHAADLLQKSLAKIHTAPGARVPAAKIISALEALIERQEDVYDQIILPELGLGERFDVRSHQLEKSGVARQYRGGEVWLFDGVPVQNWLHAPLLIPFEDLEDTLILARVRDLPAGVARQLRPPLIPGVRRALEALDWVVIDSGGFEGGRMEHAEFLDEIGERPWIRVDHDPETGAARFETWRGEEAQSGWASNIFDAFEYLAGDPDAPVQLHDPNWPKDPDAKPFETAVSLDLLDDPYSICRRLIFQDAGLDIDRLGPLVTWKDSPDMLFEFTDEDDSMLSDIGSWMASRFDGDAAYFAALMADWFAEIRANLPVEVPGLGFLHEVVLPALVLRRPRPLVGALDAGTTILAPLRLFAATDLPAEEWIDTE